MRKCMLVLLMGLLMMVIADCEAQNMKKKIVIFGSSITAGWVTSEVKQYDMNNGWAFRLGRLLQQQGWEVVNAGVPGDTTASALKRFDKNVINARPAIAVISLSLGNEGLGTKNSDELIAGFIANIKIMIDKCEQVGILPVLGNCYANNDYSQEDFETIQKANRELHKLGLPMINLLGGFSDEKGHFPPGHTFDEGHPDNFGHEEMFLAVVPDMFDARIHGKTAALSTVSSEYMKLGRSENISEIYYVPQEVCHSFSWIIDIKECRDFVMQIIATDGKHTLTVDKGRFVYTSPTNAPSSGVLTSDSFKLALTHSYGLGNTNIYIDAKLMTQVTEKIELLQLSFASKKGVSVKDMLFYRGSKHQNEIIDISNGIVDNAGLEVHSTLGNGLQNTALSNVTLLSDKKEAKKNIAALKKKIVVTDTIRANTPIFKDKEAVKLSDIDMQKFNGVFFGEQCGDMIVEVKDGKIELTVFGNKAPMLPESTSKLFLRHPGEVTLTYSADFSTVELNAFGQLFKATRK